MDTDTLCMGEGGGRELAGEQNNTTGGNPSLDCTECLYILYAIYKQHTHTVSVRCIYIYTARRDIEVMAEELVVPENSKIKSRKRKMADCGTEEFLRLLEFFVSV